MPATTAAAADTDVVINEIYFNPVSGVDGDEFLELHNRGTTAVDLSGWAFTAGITGTFPVGTTIAANGYLVVSKDAARYQATYGTAPGGVYTGSLSNGGERVTLTSAAAVAIDSVAYTDRDPWPTVTDGTGPSLELIDPALENDDSVNWAASTSINGRTPGAVNSVRATGLKPRITAVTNNPAAPNRPAAGQPITVNATITGQTSAVVRYRVNHNAEQTVSMTNAGGDQFTAQIPGGTAGQLIRYRVEATNTAGTNTWPRTDDSSPYTGVVVANGITSNVPVIEWFIADADYNLITANPTKDVNRKAVLAYKGQVFDGIQVNIRGQGSQTSVKPNWKIEMPKNHEITFDGSLGPVDEFAMQADYSDPSHGRPLLAWESFQYAGGVRAQVFPIRTQKNGAFLGLYTYVDLFDGTWRDREGFSSKQFFKAETSAFSSSTQLEEVRFEKKNPEDGDFTSLREFLTGVSTLTGTARREFLLANADIPEMLNWAVTAAIVQHTDSATKNWYLVQDPTTGRWTIIPWDLDHTFGNTCCGVNSPMVTPAEPGDNTSVLMRALLAETDWQQMYFRRARSQVDQVLAAGRLEGVYDARVAPAAPEITLDLNAWPRQSTLSYSGQRTRLFSYIQARRTAFNSDSRVPSAQANQPNIVISEIQHSPLPGTNAEFIELYNPSTTQAIDLSGWTLSGAVTATIQPGTVITPGGRMTLVKDDPTFRATYGSTVFVGGRYSGDLLPGETLTLTRAATSGGGEADSVTFGGAGWPDASAGPSLELVNLAADNNDGANWALSVMPSGSPGAANQTVFPGNVPGAPTIGNATAGGNLATVAWTAPANNGGAAITGYVVKVVDPTTSAQVGALRPVGRTATSAVVSGLTAGVAYQFQVAAINVAGLGAFSSSSATVTPVVPAAPGRPGSGSPSSGTAGGSVTATARWTAPTSAGSAPITAYRVTAYQMSGTQANATVLATSEAPIKSPSSRSHIFQLTPGTYRFRVEALNTVGWSPVSTLSTAVTAQ